MKRIILIFLFCFVLSGCEASDEQFTLECKKSTTTTDITDKTVKEIVYDNHDKVINITVNRVFKAKNTDGISTLKNIKQSAEDYYNDIISDAIKVSIKKDSDKEYNVIYYLDVSKMYKDELDYLNVNQDFLKYQKVLEKEKFKCQRKK